MVVLWKNILEASVNKTIRVVFWNKKRMITLMGLYNRPPVVSRDQNRYVGRSQKV